MDKDFSVRDFGTRLFGNLNAFETVWIWQPVCKSSYTSPPLKETSRDSCQSWSYIYEMCVEDGALSHVQRWIED